MLNKYLILSIALVAMLFQSCKNDKLVNYKTIDIYRLFEDKKDDSLKIIVNYLIKKDCVEALYFKGFFKQFCTGNRNDDSILYYMERAKMLFPKDVQVNYILGRIYFDYDKLKSLQCYTEVINNIDQSNNTNNYSYYFKHSHFIKIDYIKLYRSYIYNLVDLKREEEALKFLDSKIKKGGVNLRLLNEKSYVKYTLGDSLGAVKDLEVYYKLFPKQLEKVIPDSAKTYSIRKIEDSFCF